MKAIVKSLWQHILPLSFRERAHCIRTQIRHFGLKYKCPFCASHLKAFLPDGFDLPVLIEKQVVGGGVRSNARCPVCYSFDRERLLYLYLKKELNIFNQKLSLLHAAPEIALSHKLKAAPNIDYVTADLYLENVTIKMDITDIQYPDNYFDAILCNHVLEHVDDDRRAMSELFRVLKPGGWAILQVPIALSLQKTYEDKAMTTPEARAAAFGQSDHVRLYAHDYLDKLQHIGFIVNLFDWWKEKSVHFGGDGNRFGLLENESIFFAVKPVGKKDQVEGRVLAAS